VQTVTITAPAPLGEKDHLPQAQAVDAATLARRRLGSSDAAALLDGQPGVSLNGAAGSRPCRRCTAWPTTGCGCRWTAWT
jgi:hypothetical protein